MAAAKLCERLAASWVLNTPPTTPLSLLPAASAIRRPAVSAKLRLSPSLLARAEETVSAWLFDQL